MNYGSVCSGIEAASVAWRSLGWGCSFLSEIDPFCRALLLDRYAGVPLHGDFTTIQPGDYAPISWRWHMWRRRQPGPGWAFNCSYTLRRGNGPRHTANTARSRGRAVSYRIHRNFADIRCPREMRPDPKPNSAGGFILACGKAYNPPRGRATPGIPRRLYACPLSRETSGGRAAL